MKRLTFCGVNDLYLTPRGAHTLKGYEEIRTQKTHKVEQQPKHTEIQVSDAMSMHNEHCIDEYGVGLH